MKKSGEGKGGEDRIRNGDVLRKISEELNTMTITKKRKTFSDGP